MAQIFIAIVSSIRGVFLFISLYSGFENLSEWDKFSSLS